MSAEAEIFNFNQIYDYASYQKYASKYRVKLGQGANGTVYKVWINNTFPIAVKEINLDEEKKIFSQQIKNLQNETNLLMKMDHQHIMKVYFGFAYINDSTNERFYYIGMECAPTDLFKILKSRKKLSQFEISQLAVQLQSALEYLELNKIAHRDLKPENILLTENGQYKLCEFSEFKWYQQTVKTYRNTLAETQSYFSPELMRFLLQFVDEDEEGLNPSNKFDYDAYKSDVFSFGLILLCCHGVNIRNLNAKEGDLKTKLNGNCSKEMKWLLEKCLAFNPQHRVSFKELSPFLKLDIVQVSHQLISSKEQLQNSINQANQLKSQQKIIKELNEQIQAANLIINDHQKDKQLQNQEIQKLNTIIGQGKQQLQSKNYQPINPVSQSSSQHKKKEKQEIINKCKSNENSWKNLDQNYRKNAFTENTQGLKWNDDIYDNIFYDNYDNYDFYNWWNEKTGKTSSFHTYWRWNNGEASYVCDKDIPKAIEIVKKLKQDTGYEFGLCLMMLHSNLWNFDKSFTDLMN